MNFTLGSKRSLQRLFFGLTIAMACASAGHAQNQPWKNPLSDREMALLVDYLTRLGASCIKADPECAKGLGSNKLAPNPGQAPDQCPPSVVWGAGAGGTAFLAGTGLAFCDLNPGYCQRLNEVLAPTGSQVPCAGGTRRPTY